LRDLLSEQLPLPAASKLLVGNETGDDAAVWCLSDEHCILSTTDFFTPIVDDPYDFGQIAAANALSDIFAMGGRPVMALAILGMPVGKLPAEVVRSILRGGADICAQVGVPVAGGHSIDVPEPIYGLAVTGICTLSSVRRNGGARPGDALLLSKPLGVGIYSAAFKRGLLDARDYRVLIETTTLLNTVGSQLGTNEAVHAMTDVTGFGLAGHALEIARASGAVVRIEADALPLLGETERFAREGVLTGASQRNWQSYKDSVELPEAMPEWQRGILCDPQTSGGLLIACSPEAASLILEILRSAGHFAATQVGTIEAGEPKVVASAVH
jgi:selenide,water dikinase